MCRSAGAWSTSVAIAPVDTRNLFSGAGVPILLEDLGLQYDPRRQEVEMATSPPTSTVVHGPHDPIRVVQVHVDGSLTAPRVNVGLKGQIPPM